MTRIFGVQRTRESDNLNIRNKMTGRIFFLRYPQLYDFFLSELKYSSVAIQRNDRPIRLHPLLLLISRLYPSALEGSESNLKLSTFIPSISGCSSSPELATRNLSAKSLVALVPPGNVVDRVFDILNELKVGFEKDILFIYLKAIHFISSLSRVHPIWQRIQRMDIYCRFCIFSDQPNLTLIEFHRKFCSNLPKRSSDMNWMRMVLVTPSCRRCILKSCLRFL